MKNKFLAFMACIAMAAGFTACSKDDAADGLQAALMVTLASPNAPNADVILNSNTTISSNMAYGQSTGYFNVIAGSNNIKVASTGTASYWINADANFDANVHYSMFVVDSVSKVKAFVVADDLSAPSSGKAKVRFFHLVPNGPAIDVALQGGASWFSNRSFNDVTVNNSVSNYTEVAAGPATLEVRLAGSSSVVLPVPSITFQEGKIYTVIAKGFIGGIGSQALNVQVIANN